MRIEELIAKLEITKNSDETHSKTGKSDFEGESPDILSLAKKGSQSRPRTKKSINNSYT